MDICSWMLDTGPINPVAAFTDLTVLLLGINWLMVVIMEMDFWPHVVVLVSSSKRSILVLECTSGWVHYDNISYKEAILDRSHRTLLSCYSQH